MSRRVQGGSARRGVREASRRFLDLIASRITRSIAFRTWSAKRLIPTVRTPETLPMTFPHDTIPIPHVRFRLDR